MAVVNPPTSRHGLVPYLDKRLGGHSGSWPEFQWHCPACLDRKGSESPERKFRLNAAKGKGTCFRCGYAVRSLEKLFRDLNGGKLLLEEADLLTGEPDAVGRGGLTEELMVRLYARLPSLRLRPVPLPPEYLPLTGNEQRFACQVAFRYLREKRGFVEGLDAFLTRFAVGYCQTGEYANRLVFPVSQGGRVVYFTTRYCGDHVQKAKNPKNQPGCHTRDDCLLNYDGCVGAEEVHVVEGPLSMAPFPHPVALMGKRMSDAQLDLLASLAEAGAKRFILTTDPDASREAREVYAAMSSRLPGVGYLPLRGGDPFDLRDSIGQFQVRDRVLLADAIRGVKPVLRLTNRADRAILH